MNREQRNSRLEAAANYAIDTEQRYAADNHDPYHSPLEGVAVIWAEVAELNHEMRDIANSGRRLQSDAGAHAELVQMMLDAHHIYDAARRAVIEAVHVAAVARKFIKCGVDAPTKYWRPNETTKDAADAASHTQ